MPPSSFLHCFGFFTLFLYQLDDNWIYIVVHSSDDISVLYFLVDEAITSKPIVME